MNKEMTPKEAFEKLVVNIMTGKLGNENKILITSVEQALNELEFYKSFPQLQEASLIPEVNLKLVTCELQLRELKIDVARYFELEEQAREKWGNGLDDVEAYEYTKLHLKLSKVGKEE